VGDISANFSRSEFACKCGCGFGLQPGDVSPALVDGLQALRNIVGAVQILSGCRCAKHNASPSVLGALNSRHLKGDAADILVMSVRPAELYAAVNMIPVFREGGVGFGYGRFHVDARGTRARWRYDMTGKTIAW